jgi:IS30 family transposase
MAGGAVAADAGVAVGVSGGCAQRWFADAGGMTPIDLGEPSGRYLSLAEREDIAVLRAQNRGVREIGRLLGRSASTISRELKRNATVRRPLRYRPSLAQAKADERARRPKVTKLAADPVLRSYVQTKLLELWSPEQISHLLVVDFPDDEGMRIGHEAIYQSIYVQGRGALRRELAACLRTGRALRKPQRKADRRRERIKDKVMISERPAEVEDRAVAGDWEGDLITGAANATAIGTLVERNSRFVMLLHLPDDHGAVAVREAIVAAMLTLPEHLRRSLTWDQGIELSEHLQIKTDADLDVYFCDPHSPWQRGTNENTNGLLRQYFPKGTDLSVHSAEELTRVAVQLNDRPRKTLDWKTPNEVFRAQWSKAA